MVEEANVGGLLDLRVLDFRARVVPAPPLATAVGEHLVEERKRVPGRLWPGAVAAHGGEEALHILDRDPVERSIAKPYEVCSQERPVRRQRRWLTAERLEVADQPLAGLLNRHPGTGGGPFRVDSPPQLAFGLPSREAVPRARLALGPDPALDALGADVPAPVPGLMPGRVGVDVERTRAVAAAAVRCAATVVQGQGRLSVFRARPTAQRFSVFRR